MREEQRGVGPSAQPAGTRGAASRRTRWGGERGRSERSERSCDVTAGHTRALRREREGGSAKARSDSRERSRTPPGAHDGNASQMLAWSGEPGGYDASLSASMCAVTRGGRLGREVPLREEAREEQREDLPEPMGPVTPTTSGKGEATEVGRDRGRAGGLRRSRRSRRRL
jgi:hypothetical protein